MPDKKYKAEFYDFLKKMIEIETIKKIPMDQILYNLSPLIITLERAQLEEKAAMARKIKRSYSRHSKPPDKTDSQPVLPTVFCQPTKRPV
jgi:hypothetical protein